jgi:hypothetical protein
LSRVFRTESGSQGRVKILKQVVIALRASMEDERSPEEQKDLLAFMLTALEQIASSVDQSASAWEKRGYWLKADRFRRDWAWVLQSQDFLTHALREEDWAAAASACSLIALHIQNIKAPSRKNVQRPWEGAWQSWKNRYSDAKR